MKELLAYIIENIIPEANATIDEENSEEYTTLKIHAPQEYIGKIIGKGGKTINAIKSIIKIKAIRENKRVEIEVLEQA